MSPEDLTLEQIEHQLQNPDVAPHLHNHLLRLKEIKIARGEGKSASPPEGCASQMSPPGASTDGSGGSSSGKFGDTFNLDFLRIGQQRNKDGEKPKRRGPKPDSKPAQTRRQELNRQAQRTHRERKERYVKGLEEEISRLRESWTLAVSEKTKFQEENRRLKALLDEHNIPYSNFVLTAENLERQRRIESPNTNGLTRSYDEIGIDFVLALERPCMQHMQFLTSASVNDMEADFHGHALMASCPPEFHSLQDPGQEWAVGTYDLPASDLVKLFQLSNRLQLEGELTPIAVWATITRHERFASLGIKDFETIQGEILPKVICYGFGAVVNEFEVHEALGRIFGPVSGGTDFSGFSSGGVSS